MSLFLREMKVYLVGTPKEYIMITLLSIEAKNVALIFATKETICIGLLLNKKSLLNKNN